MLYIIFSNPHNKCMKEINEFRRGPRLYSLSFSHFIEDFQFLRISLIKTPLRKVSMPFSASRLAADTVAEISIISTPECQTKSLPGTC